MSESHVKIFARTNRGIAVHIAKNIGQLDLKEGTTPKVSFSGGSYEISRTIIRRQSLGKKSLYTLLIIGFKYKKQKMVLPAASDDHGGVIKGDEATVEITLTNEPPAGGDPEDIEIVATDDNPNTEDDSPELPDSDVLLNT